MFCPECGTELAANSRFCHECGTKTEIDNVESKNNALVLEEMSDPNRNNPLAKAMKIAKDYEDDVELLKDFVEDVKLIIENYGANEVKNEIELEDQIRKIDSYINLKRKELDKNLKVLSSDKIQIKKISDKNKPFKITYSLSIKQKEQNYRLVLFTDSDNNKTELKVYLEDNRVDIPDIGFNNSFPVRSINGTYVLAYMDRYFVKEDGSSVYGGFSGVDENRIIGGQVIFVNQDELFLINDVHRPCDGKVAENGNFVINDWMFPEELSGTFFAFNSKAEILIKKIFNSNLGNNAISEDGKYAALETLVSKSDDQDKLFFFDLSNKELLWERTRDLGNIKSFQFDTDNEILFVLYDNGLKYRHSFNGEILDQDKLEEERIEHANGYELFSIAEEKMKQIEQKDTSLSDYEEVLSLLEKASQKNISDHTKARIHRLIGEIYYNHDNTDGAIQNFEKALSYDPKIGVKRLFDKLKNS